MIVPRKFAAIAWIAACIGCSLAVIHFYGVFRAGRMYPFRSHLEQGAAVLRTSLVATLLSSWAIWFGARRRNGLAIVALRTGLAAQLTLALYGIAGCGGVLGGDFTIGGWRGSTDLIFPATFFSEYNWLTFIFEVAPVTSVTMSLSLYALLRLRAARDVSASVSDK
jgi:hypothetical protein